MQGGVSENRGDLVDVEYFRRLEVGNLLMLLFGSVVGFCVVLVERAV